MTGHAKGSESVTVSWTNLDQIAEREATALKQARRHRSVFQHKSQPAGIVNREQAVFDEHLSEHSPTCYYCGRTLDKDIPSERRTIDNEFIDICTPCAFLHGLVERVERRSKRQGRRHYGRQNRAPVRV